MIKLFRHQQVALTYLKLNDSFMLNMEQGTGKTLPALQHILDLSLFRKIDNCLVVCPKSVIASWYRDIEKFSESRQKLLKKIVTVINYDKVWRDKSYRKSWDMIILDEAHSIKNRTARRSAFLLELAITAKYRYLLTGTPISNGRLEDFWSLICFLNPYKKGRFIYSNIFKEMDGGKGSYQEWIQKYAILDMYHKPYKYVNIEHLQDIVNTYSFRIKKSQCLDLPAKLPDEIMEIEIPSKKLYDDIAKRSASIELDFVADNPLVRLTKLRQLASGFFIDGKDKIDYHTEKEQALKEFLAGFFTEDNNKLVIFAEFKESISRIGAVLLTEKIKYVVLDGEQKDKGIWRRFQNESDIQVIVCQYASACQGIDLFASNTMLFYEPTLRSNILEQAKDRIHRQGQKVACSYFHILAKGTVEKAIYKALNDYSDFNEKLFTRYIHDYVRSKR